MRLDPALRLDLDERATEEGKPPSEVDREALGGEPYRPFEDR